MIFVVENEMISKGTFKISIFDWKLVGFGQNFRVPEVALMNTFEFFGYARKLEFDSPIFYTDNQKTVNCERKLIHVSLSCTATLENWE